MQEFAELIDRIKRIEEFLGLRPFNISIKYMSVKTRLTEAEKRESSILAKKLIELQIDFPLFMQDVDPLDPDLDMEIGFKTYEDLSR